MTATLLIWLLSTSALVVSIIALVVTRHSSGRYQLRQLAELTERLQDLAHSHESLTLQLRNIRSRMNMAASRQKKATDDASDAHTNGDALSRDEQWLRETNLALATGKIRPRG